MSFRLALLRLWELRFPLERAALLRDRVDADDFERAEAPEERDEPPRDPPLAEREDLLGFAFVREPLDELVLLCPLREADLLAAIRDTLRSRLVVPVPVPIQIRNNPYVQGFADGIGCAPWARATTS